MTIQLLVPVAGVPAIVGIVQVAKGLGMPARYAPLLAVLCGIIGAVAQTMAGQYPHSAPWIQAAVAGVAVGLSASGLYSGGKAMTQQLGDRWVLVQSPGTAVLPATSSLTPSNSSAPQVPSTVSGQSSNTDSTVGETPDAAGQP